MADVPFLFTILTNFSTVVLCGSGNICKILTFSIPFYSLCKHWRGAPDPLK